ncbi:MAG: alpha/beta fold hydrolase [Pirellulales bacterium]
MSMIQAGVHVTVDLVFEEIGSGPPVVILHGLFGSKRNWSSIAKKLGQDYRVVTADLRNHGESPWCDSHDYFVMADDVACLIEKEIGSAVSLIGHSMGGKVAMVLALAQPKMVEKLVVVDIPPARSVSSQMDLIDAMQSVPLMQFKHRTQVSRYLADKIPDSATRSFLMTNLIAQPGGLTWAINLESLSKNFECIQDFPEQNHTIPFQRLSLFLTGGDSDYVRPEHHHEIRRLFPAAILRSIPEAGHWVHAEAPEPFLNVARQFLGTN